MIRFGMMKKLGLALGGFAVLTVTGSFVLFVLLDRFQTGLSDILDNAQPKSVASFEMEINAREVGVAVKGFLHHSEPVRRKLLEDAVRDFNKFHANYENLAVTGEQRALASDIDIKFDNYVTLGRRLIEQKTIYLAQQDAVITSLVEIEEKTKTIAAGDDGGNINAPGSELRQMRFLAMLWAEIAEALSLMSKVETDTSEAGTKFEREISKINTLLDGYAKNWPEEDKAEWLDKMSLEFARTTELTHQLVAVSELINEDLKLFAEYGKQLNDLLDDRLHRDAETDLQTLYDELKVVILIAYRLLAAWQPVVALVIGGVLVFILRGVVRPMRILAHAADRISAGDFSQPVELRQNDELGDFARTFNIMSERLQAAYDSLSEANAALDVKVALRTNELSAANEQLNNELELRKKTEHELRAASEAANAASGAKTLFLGNMSHELRTPLNAIIGFSDIIKSELLGPSGNGKYTEYANDINQSGLHLLRLINELLDVSRIEAGQLQLSEEDFDLAAILAASMHMLEEQAAAKRVFLSRNIPASLPLLHGDYTRVEQIFINLIGNAIKFTPSEGTVRVSAVQLSEGGVQVIVEDNGIGIAPDDLAKVFETFGQVENTLARAHEGAGLGLPLAKALAERHDGTLLINSAPGRGTAVTVTFPASRTVARADMLKQAVS